LGRTLRGDQNKPFGAGQTAHPAWEMAHYMRKSINLQQRRMLCGKLEIKKFPKKIIIFQSIINSSSCGGVPIGVGKYG
jgi:hypothetical protein